MSHYTNFTEAEKTALMHAHVRRMLCSEKGIGVLFSFIEEESVRKGCHESIHGRLNKMGSINCNKMERLMFSAFTLEESNKLLARCQELWNIAENGRFTSFESTPLIKFPVEIIPELNMGVTEIMHSDRHAYTIVNVASANKIEITRDRVKRIDKNGMSECQNYEYTSDPNGYRIQLRKNKAGQWKEVRCPHGSTFVLGRREEYYDYSF